jgi:short-subunit dehydrogenase
VQTSYGHIVITGASSGIGAALARLYARPGVMLSLTGRNGERLSEVAQKCRALGAEVSEEAVDVTDAAGMEAFLKRADAQKEIDLIIANAGIGAGTGKKKTGENPAQVEEVFRVNWQGVLNTIHPLLPAMTARGRGQIALMSSLAGFRGWPGAPSYCASKAAVKVYGEGLRGALAGSGVKVNVICPGFVESRMTDENDFPMPFIMPVERAAIIIANGLSRDRGRICFPWHAHAIVWLLNLLPDVLAQQLLRPLPTKKERTTNN